MSTYTHCDGCNCQLDSGMNGDPRLPLEVQALPRGYRVQIDMIGFDACGLSCINVVIERYITGGKIQRKGGDK